MSLDEQLDICARALLNNLLKVQINWILYPVSLSNDSKRLT